MGPKPHPPITKTCPHCAGTFVVAFKFRHRKYCGHRCVMLANPQIRESAATPEAIAKRADARRGSGKGMGYIKRGGRHEHRAVAEQKIGRRLERGEVAHHVNENKRDNAPSNIDVMPRPEHSRLHSLGSKRTPRKICKRGHPLDGDNVLIKSSGRRRCRICEEAWRAAHLAQLRERKK